MRTFVQRKNDRNLRILYASDERGFKGYGDLKLANLPKPEASNGKVMVRMTAGANGCMLFPPVTVLPPEARRQSCLSTEVNNNV